MQSCPLMLASRGLVLLLCLAACAEPVPPLPEVVPRISQTIPGQVEFFAAHILDDPGMTLASYAVGNDGACNGAFIGPNLFMGAAHCGIDISTVTKTVYPDLDVATPAHEFVDCKMILQHFDPPLNGSDIQLRYCDDFVLSDGTPIAPGDYFGYLDFDLRDPVYAGDEGIYSLFLLPFNGISHWPVLWAPGEQFWWSGGPPQPWVVQADIWGVQGVSGSAAIAGDTHQWVVPPTALVSVSGSTRTFYRSLGAVLANESVTPNASATSPQVHDARIMMLGLDPRDYEAPLDGDGNGVLDLQQDIESTVGERLRDLYRFGFESRRNNAHWNRGPNTGLTVGVMHGGAVGYLLHWGAQPATVAVHEGVSLRPHTTYAISLEVDVFWAESPTDNFGIQLLDAAGQPDGAITWIDAPAGAQALHAEFETGADPQQLAVSVDSGWFGEIHEIAVREACADLDLDTHDQRKIWRDPNTGGHAMIVAGDDGADMEWELWVDDLYAASTKMLGAVPGHRYDLCLQAQAGPTTPLSANQQLQVDVTGTSGSIASATAGIGALKRSVCVQVTASAGTTLTLAKTAGPANTSIVVDDISVECLDCPLSRNCEVPGEETSSVTAGETSSAGDDSSSG